MSFGEGEDDILGRFGGFFEAEEKRD